jgi:hypothetical protein
VLPMASISIFNSILHILHVVVKQPTGVFVRVVFQSAADSRADENMAHSLVPSPKSRGLSAMDGSGIETSDDIGVTFWP